MGRSSAGENRFWDAERGQVHSVVRQHIAEVEASQSKLFSRFVKLAFLYDPHGVSWVDDEKRSQVTENVCASAVESITAQVTINEVRARFMTDGADWSTQRRARHREMYAAGLSKLLDLNGIAGEQFKASGIKGTGVAVCFADTRLRKIIARHVLLDDVVVDNRECRNGRKPRQIHIRMVEDKDELKARYPKSSQQIEAAAGRYDGSERWASDLSEWQFSDSQVLVTHSWRLPIGKKGDKSYKAGRYAVTIEAHDLEVTKYEKDRFPVCRLPWEEREQGWYAIGLIERIAGHQREINKLNWQEDRQRDQHAVPTTYVDWVDRKLEIQSIGRAGTIVAIRGRTPETVSPKGITSEQSNRRRELKESAYDQTGQNRLAATGMKPAGIDSGVGLREYKDQSSQRHAMQERAFERAVLDLHLLALDAAKDLGKDAPVILTKAVRGGKRLRFSDVDMDEAVLQIEAASNLAKTPSGRLQLALEWAQAGVISMDEFRRLAQHPDTDRAMSLYTAALDNIEATIEAILDGEVLVPEPYQNLKMGIWRFEMALLKAKDDGAPEEILEALRQWTSQAAGILAMQSAGPQPTAGAADALAPADPQAVAAAAGPPIGPEPAPTLTGAGVTPVNLLQ